MSLKLGELRISSPAFAHCGQMGKEYAGDGGNMSPQLDWTGAPRGTLQFVLICHDPDAPRPQGFTHWVVYNIPAVVTGLAKAEKQDAFTPGVNDAGKKGYVGPYPPKGHGVHHYYFWLYAVGKELNLESGLNRAQVLDAISTSVLEQARIVGTYER